MHDMKLVLCEGDTVESIVSSPYGLSSINVGSVGVVVHVQPYSVGVRWDFDTPDSEAHNCGGRCEEGYGWYVGLKDVKLIAHELPDLTEQDQTIISSFILGGAEDGI